MFSLVRARVSRECGDLYVVVSSGSKSLVFHYALVDNCYWLGFHLEVFTDAVVQPQHAALLLGDAARVDKLLGRLVHGRGSALSNAVISSRPNARLALPSTRIPVFVATRFCD